MQNHLLRHVLLLILLITFYRVVAFVILEVGTNNIISKAQRNKTQRSF